jgi:hypothetical protein
MLQIGLTLNNAVIAVKTTFDGLVMYWDYFAKS